MARAIELRGRPASVRQARVFTGDVLADDGVEASVIELAVLLVSELVTNAIVHARATICLTIHTDAHWGAHRGGRPGPRTPRAAPCDTGPTRGTRLAGGRQTRDRLGNRTARNPQGRLVRDRSLGRSPCAWTRVSQLLTRAAPRGRPESIVERLDPDCYEPLRTRSNN